MNREPRSGRLVLRRHLLATATALLLTCAPTFAADPASPTPRNTPDKGACVPAQPELKPLNLGKLVAEAVKAGKTELKLESGQYAVEPVVLQKLNGFTLDGGGAVLNFPPERTAFEITACNNLTLRNFSVDYTRFSFTQGTVIAVDAAAKTIDLRLHAGYPQIHSDAPRQAGKVLELHLHVFDAATRTWKDGAPDLYTNRYQDLGNGVVRFSFEFENLNRYVVTGDLLALDWRNTSGITIRGGTANLRMQDVTIYTAPSIAIIGRFCKGGHVFQNVRIVRGPRPTGATEDRLLSSCADGFNYAYCAEGPQLIGCEFSFMGDDSVNLHGSPFAVFRVEDAKNLLLLRPHGREEFDAVFTPGAQVRLLKGGNYAPVATATANALSYLAGTPTKPQDGAQEFLQKMKLKPLSNNNSPTDHSLFRLTLEQPLEGVEPGMFLDLPALNCRNYQIRDSYFHDHRARGLRVMACDGMIENNRFERIAQAAISIGAEYAYWREAGWAENVIVRNNTIRDVCRSWNATGPGSYALGAICTFIRNDDGVTPFASGHRNLTIENNRIDGCRTAGIHLYALDNARVTGNTLQNTCRGDLDGKLNDAGSSYGLRVTAPITVLDNAKGVVLNDNRIQ